MTPVDWEPLSPAEWDRQYDEAMQWRDWDTCDYLLSIRSPIEHGPDDVLAEGTLRVLKPFDL